MNQMEAARKGKATPEMEFVSRTEAVPVEKIVEGVRAGRMVVPSSTLRELKRPCGIGEGLRAKVNANIGTSPDESDLTTELCKLRVAIQAGTDTVMDLSTGGNLREIRKAIVSECDVPLGSVPVYEIAVDSARSGKQIADVTGDEMLAAVELHAGDGIDFVTVHCGVTLSVMEMAKKARRVTDVVSRGGAILLEWMHANKKENPFYSRYDDLLDIARKYDLTLSLGDGMRPGSLADANDTAQFGELLVIGELVRRARSADVQVIVEGPGHVPIHLVEANVALEKTTCDGAPFYVLGPLVTDVAPGYDHIVGAIGGALAAAKGADFLCYVTPSEHLRLPSVEDVRVGVIASRIAGHAADVARGVPGAAEWDRSISEARRALDWKKELSMAIDPERAESLRASSPPRDPELCTMCSDFCAMKKSSPVFRNKS
ncbi:MAG: phosphomethylpyrimidine synthase ThiC [Candidatus Eiseniibacteriota bacterium]|nr:MAG: phosphomethylpyrimidine synthase ThiC [Candidatus Eisenbacteria bacterium]